MDSRVIELLQAVLDGWWTLMTAWKLPVLNITPAQGLLFMAITPLTIKFMKDLLQVGTSNLGRSKGGK